MGKNKEKLKPILDEKITKELNLRVLQRIDPCIEEILTNAAHVAIYELNIEASQWSRKNVEGSLFVVKRNTKPHYQFIVMNRQNTENLTESLWGDFVCEVQDSYLLYRNHTEEVNGIWFYISNDCKEIANLFTRILNEYPEVPTELKVSSKESEVEKDAALEPSSTADSNVADGIDDLSVVKISSLDQSPTALVSDPPTSPSISAPAPVTSPSTLKLSIPAISEPKDAKTYMTDLVKPSLFLSPHPSSPHILPSITSFAPPPPHSPLISPSNLKRPHGELLLPMFPPPSPQSSTPTSVPTPTCISREKIRKALQFLIQDDQFIEIVYRAVVNAPDD
ncbi:mRNA-decapping enzyme-like protein [Salvia miltiorrhiza]|uniref:mRNA-decapping enzyme-like protein n=1 Tax=Salvia miltiorrhiza TaxID=226208 RepID=UPI0025ABA8E2|nr:mRNA-decapping enzyme-like protein [Salvia miltiorrhiza]